MAQQLQRLMIVPQSNGFSAAGDRHAEPEALSGATPSLRTQGAHPSLPQRRFSIHVDYGLEAAKPVPISIREGQALEPGVGIIAKAVRF
jgi:hypothetical protein